MDTASVSGLCPICALVVILPALVLKVPAYFVLLRVPITAPLKFAFVKPSISLGSLNGLPVRSDTVFSISARSVPTLFIKASSDIWLRPFMPPVLMASAILRSLARMLRLVFVP